jgi:tight adherence protein B
VTPATFWLGRFGVACVALFLISSAWALFGGWDGPARAALRRRSLALDGKLRFVRSRLRGRDVLLAQAGFGLLVVAAALGLRAWPLLSILAVGALVPNVVVDRLVARRIAAIETQIEPWIGIVANALKASPSLGEAIASSTALVPPPISEEVDVLIKEYELGTPLDRALDAFAERIGSNTLAGTVLALKVAREAGGNLTSMLENAAAALRELARLEGVVRTKTAEGKAQAFVIGLIPLPLVIGIHMMDPHFFDPLTQSLLGNLIIAGSAVLWASAILLARKILAVDV